jgi:hypothetical protein
MTLYKKLAFGIGLQKSKLPLFPRYGNVFHVIRARLARKPRRGFLITFGWENMVNLADSISNLLRVPKKQTYMTVMTGETKPLAD